MRLHFGSRTLYALAIVASVAVSPAQAAGPADVGTLSPALRLSLPDTTPITLRGKTLTLGAIRSAHVALLAYFQSAAAHKPVVLPTAKPIVITKEGGAASPTFFQPVIRGGTSVAAPTPSPAAAAYTHVASPVTSGPIDYMAACSKVTVCVFIPSNSFTSITWVYDTYIVIVDPLLGADVCQADGGSMASSACNLTYPLVASASAFPGNPPAMQDSVNCPAGDGFAITVDPLGAAQIKNHGQQGASAMTCAIDLFVPSK